MHMDIRDLIAKRSALLYYLLRKSPVTRSDLVEVMEVSQPTITQWLKDLLAADLVREVGISTRSSNMGRPRILIELNPEAAWAGAFHITSRTAEVGLVNWIGQVVESATISWEAMEMSYSRALLEILVNKLAQWLKERNIPDSRMLGLGVATAGPVDNQQGEVITYNLEDGVRRRHSFPVRDILTALTPWPIRMDTNAWAIASGERWFGSKYENFMVIHAHEGVAAGTVLNGQLYRGSGLAGELFSVNVIIHNPASPLCGRKMQLSDIVRRKAVLARIPSEKGLRDLDQVVIAANQGDTEVLQVLMDCAEALVIVCSPLVNTLDLDAVVLSGPIFEVPAVVAYIRRYIQEQSFTGVMENRPPQVTPISVQRQAGLVGAASLVFNSVFQANTNQREYWAINL
jgi:predicted NBD/HSP70 family sugar kinase